MYIYNSFTFTSAKDGFEPLSTASYATSKYITLQTPTYDSVQRDEINLTRVCLFSAF